jgi:hypothetical protein
LAVKSLAKIYKKTKRKDKEKFLESVFDKPFVGRRDKSFPTRIFSCKMNVLNGKPLFLKNKNYVFGQRSNHCEKNHTL